MTVTVDDGETRETPLYTRRRDDHGHGRAQYRGPGRAGPADGGVGGGQRHVLPPLTEIDHEPEGGLAPAREHGAARHHHRLRGGVQEEHRDYLYDDYRSTVGQTRHHRRRSRGWKPTRPTTCGCGRRTVRWRWAWSLVGTGSTNKEGNSPPKFNETDSRGPVPENTPAGENVGSPVTATDGDTTTLTYETRRSRRGPVQLRHPVRADTDEGPPESRGPACGYICDTANNPQLNAPTG